MVAVVVDLYNRWTSLKETQDGNWKSPKMEIHKMCDSYILAPAPHLNHDRDDRRNDIRETDLSVFRMCRCRGGVSKVYKTEKGGPVWETLPGGHHEASPPCLCHLLRCGIGISPPPLWKAVWLRSLYPISHQETYTETILILILISYTYTYKSLFKVYL